MPKYVVTVDAPIGPGELCNAIGEYLSINYGDSYVGVQGLAEE